MRKEELLVRLDKGVCMEMFYNNFEEFIKQFGEVLKNYYDIRIEYNKETHTIDIHYSY